MLSIIIKTKNSADNLYDILEALKKIKKKLEIIILDENSNDDTIKIATEFKAKIKFFNKFEFENIYNETIKEAKNDWILTLKDNEIVPKETLAEILRYIEKTKKNSISLAIKTFYLKKELKSAHTRSIKLFKRNSKKIKIHKFNEKFHILKYEKNIYENLKEKFENTKIDISKKPSIFFKPLFKFLYCYFLKGAIFEGKIGFIFAYRKVVEEFILNCMIFEKEYKNDI